MRTMAALKILGVSGNGIVQRALDNAWLREHPASASASAGRAGRRARNGSGLGKAVRADRTAMVQSLHAPLSGAGDQKQKAGSGNLTGLPRRSRRRRRAGSIHPVGKTATDLSCDTKRREM